MKLQLLISDSRHLSLGKGVQRLADAGACLRQQEVGAFLPVARAEYAARVAREGDKARNTRAETRTRRWREFLPALPHHVTTQY